MKTTGGALLAGAALAVVLAGCSSGNNQTSPTTSTTAAATSAPCTQSAILTATRSATGLGPVQSVVNFGCSGSWAYANVTVGSGSAAFDAVIVLQAQGSAWAVQNRGTACSNHLVPSDLYTQACTTS